MMQYHSLHVFDEAFPSVDAIPLNPLLKRETLRRLAWSVFYLDTMVDAGRHGVHNVTEEGYRIQLPCSEPSFARGSDVKTMGLREYTRGLDSSGLDTGISTQVIITAAVRRRLLHFWTSTLKYSTDPPASHLEHLHKLESELDRIMVSLPADLAYTEDNLYVLSGQRTALVLLHALRHTTSILLARIQCVLSERFTDKLDMAIAARRNRIRHALAIARLAVDAKRVDINLDPCVAFQSYTALEGMSSTTIETSFSPRVPEIGNLRYSYINMVQSCCLNPRN
jgi:hypothetical protein